MVLIYMVWQVQQEEKLGRKLAKLETKSSAEINNSPIDIKDVPEKEAVSEKIKAPVAQVKKSKLSKAATKLTTTAKTPVIKSKKLKTASQIKSKSQSRIANRFVLPKKFKKEVVVYDIRDVPYQEVKIAGKNGKMVDAEMVEKRKTSTTQCKETTINERNWIDKDNSADRKSSPSQTIYLVKGIKVEISQALSLDQKIQVTASISGGSSPYQIKWDNGQIGDRAYYKGSGYHYVVVEDAHGCGLLQDFKLKPVGQLNLVENSEEQPLKPDFIKPLEPKRTVRDSKSDTKVALKFDSPSYQIQKSDQLSGDLMDFIQGGSGEKLKFEVLRSSSQGELKFSYDGKFDYLPKANFEGKDAFSVSICDDQKCLLGRVEVEVGSERISSK